MSANSETTISAQFLENLLRGIRHDVGAPTRHLLNFSRMLNELNDLPLEDKHRQWLLYIQRGSTQLQDMLNSLSGLSQLYQQREFSQFNLGEVFLQAQQKNNTSATLELPQHWPMVNSCKAHWQILFFNLLSNALLFHPLNQEHHKQVKVACEQNAGQVIFTIEDNGIGVSEKNRSEIRRAFKRLNDSQDYPGLGMGLSYCDLIAELNHASLEFSDSPLGGLRVQYCQTC